MSKPNIKLLDSLIGIHPRIYLNSERINYLREAIKSTHTHLWDKVCAQADSALRRGAPAYIEDDGHSGDEQLWQRGVGNTMPVLAIAYTLTGRQEYLDGARKWAIASCGYRTWGLGRIDGMDLAAGHQLLGLGIVYDWCYDALDEETRQTIRQTLVKRTSAMYNAAAGITQSSGKKEFVWWHRSYMQNHLWVNICGMAVAGLALFDEVDDAYQWISLPLDKFQRTMDALGDDGASHEGVGYWGYGVEYMLKFMHLARELLGVDMYNNDWWRNTAAYRQYLALPHSIWTGRNNIVDIADCPCGNWYGPDYLLRALAREYRDGYAQWLAEQVDDANVDSPEARWLNLIWFDPDVEAKPPDTRPTLHHFSDMGIVSARSDWSGDESMVVFKCGPFIGHKGVREFDYDPGGGHVHPDANHFVLFGCGEWLIRDDGYRSKWTGQHNTLLINGRGQLGEGRMWFNGSEQLKLKALPRIVRAVSTPNLDHIIGDATEAYPRDIGLKHYIRHLLFLKPDVLIVADDVAVDDASELELRFHTERNQVERDGDAVIICGDNTLLRLELLTGEGVNISAGDIAGEGRHGETNFTMFTIQLSARTSQWRNAVALSWAKSKADLAKVVLQMDGDTWKFHTQDRVATLVW